VETDGKSSVKLSISKYALNLDKGETITPTKGMEVVKQAVSDTVREEKRSAGKHFSREVVVAPGGKASALGFDDLDIDKEESITSS